MHVAVLSKDGHPSVLLNFSLLTNRLIQLLAVSLSDFGGVAYIEQIESVILGILGFVILNLKSLLLLVLEKPLSLLLFQLLLLVDFLPVCQSDVLVLRFEVVGEFQITLPIVRRGHSSSLRLLLWGLFVSWGHRLLLDLSAINLNLLELWMVDDYLVDRAQVF